MSTTITGDIILESPDGTLWTLGVDDDGDLVTEAIEDGEAGTGARAGTRAGT